MSERSFPINKSEQKTAHWGLLSEYRREIMGIATLLVMCCHSTFQWSDSFFIKIIRTAFTSGNVGVELFLLLSGAGLCFAYEKRSSLGRFYLHRYVRILVPYLLLCIPYWAWRDLLVGKDNFFMNVFQITLPYKGVITFWYITFSAAYYLAFPLVYNWINGQLSFGKTLTREMRTTTLFLLVMLALFVMMYRHPTLYRNCEIGMTRFLVFVIGCHLGSLVKEKRHIPGHWVLISAVTCIAIPLLYKMVSMHDYWYRIFYVAFGVGLLIVLMWLMQRDWMKWSHGILRFCGDRSVELYITHVSIRNIFETYNPSGFLDRKTVSGYLVVLILAFIVSTLTHPVIKGLSNILLKKRIVSK